MVREDFPTPPSPITTNLYVGNLESSSGGLFGKAILIPKTNLYCCKKSNNNKSNIKIKINISCETRLDSSSSDWACSTLQTTAQGWLRK